MYHVVVTRVGKGLLHKQVDAVSVEHVFTEGTVVEHALFTKADASTISMSLQSEGASDIKVFYGERQLINI